MYLTPEEDAAIEKAAAANGMKKRPWCMMVIMEAAKAYAESQKEWVFKMVDGRVLRAFGRNMGQAWHELGYSSENRSLMAEYKSAEEAQAAGWLINQEFPVEQPKDDVVKDVDLPFDK